MHKLKIMKIRTGLIKTGIWALFLGTCYFVATVSLVASIKKENLPEDVKEVIETRYRFVKREEEYSRHLKGYSIFKYDERGREIEWSDYNEDGSLVAQYVPKYNNKGNLLEGYWYRATGQVYWESIETFERDDPQDEVDRTFGGKTISKHDKQGNETERALYNPQGSLVCKYRYKYDANRNKILVARYKTDDTLDYKYTYKYDDKRQLIEWARYQADGSLNFKYSYRYDEKGQISEMVEYDTTGAIVSKSYPEYDDRGKLIEWKICNADGNLQTRTTFKYNAQGNKIEELRYNYREQFGKAKEIPIELITWEYKYFYDEK